jgi:transposase-like protein
MAMNWVQFQQGMSLPEFLRSFGTEEQCAEAVMRARWPKGFNCPRCGGGTYCMVRHEGRSLFQCNTCRRQTSVTAGTLFAGTKLPLKIWFLAIYRISQAKTGISALALKREIGVSYPTAWLIHHKVMRAMAERDSVHQLGGTVQMDDAYLGGERSGGKVGRGSENKVPFVAAVSLDANNHPRYLKLAPLAGFTMQAIKQWAATNLQPGSCVSSDGLGCFAAVTEAGCVHKPTVVGQAKPRELPEFQWVNTIVGNLKTSLSGAYKAFKYGKYAAPYLAAFAYRFNRRFNLRDLVVRLIVDTVRCQPRSQRAIRKAEDHF